MDDVLKKMILTDEETNEEIRLALSEDQKYILFLNKNNEGFYISLSLIKKFHFDANFLYITIPDRQIRILRHATSDDDLKAFIKFIKGLQKDSTEGRTYTFKELFRNALLPYGYVENDENENDNAVASNSTVSAEKIAESHHDNVEATPEEASKEEVEIKSYNEAMQDLNKVEDTNTIAIDTQELKKADLAEKKETTPAEEDDEGGSGAQKAIIVLLVITIVLGLAVAGYYTGVLDNFIDFINNAIKNFNK